MFLVALTPYEIGNIFNIDYFQTYLDAFYEFIEGIGIAFNNALTLLTNSLPFVLTIISFLPGIVGSGIMIYIIVAVIKFFRGVS